MSGALLQALVDFVYASVGQDPPLGTTTEEEMVADIKRFANDIRWEDGLVTKDYVRPNDDL